MRLEIGTMAGDAPAGYSSGGMVTKLAAARIAMGAGCRMAIATGNGPNPLRALDGGAPCTWFLPSAEPKTARKRWIRSEEHTSELQSLMRTSYAVHCLKTKTLNNKSPDYITHQSDTSIH